LNLVLSVRITGQQEFEALTSSAESLCEEILSSYHMAQRHPPMTADSKELQISQAIVALQPFGHRTPPKPPRATPTHGVPSLLYPIVYYDSAILFSMRAVKKQNRNITRATLYDVVGAVKKNL
jgi:hypothetical protein